MRDRHTITAPQPESFWHEWGMDEGANNSCRDVSVVSDVNSAGTVQYVEVNATMTL
jgi:hypothetical protein